MLFLTGATGKLGRQTLDVLLAEVAAEKVRVMAREPSVLSAYAQRGVEVVKADYDEPESLRAALRGVHVALLISSNDLERRVAQHRAFLQAACKNAVGRLVYTSLLRADVSKLTVAEDHWTTEEDIRQAGLPATILRNGWYLENYTDRIGELVAQGGLHGAAKAGRVCAASRHDFACAAAHVLLGKGGVGGIHELAGDEPFTLSQFVEEVAQQTGKPLHYTDLEPSALRQQLLAASLPAPLVDFLVNVDEGIAAGELEDDTGDLRKLLGRPTATLKQAVAATLGSRP